MSKQVEYPAIEAKNENLCFMTKYTYFSKLKLELFNVSGKQTNIWPMLGFAVSSHLPVYQSSEMTDAIQKSNFFNNFPCFTSWKFLFD